MTELAATSDVTVKELNELTKKILEKRREIEEFEKTMDAKKKEADALYAQAMMHFDTLEIDKWTLKGVGTLYTDNRVMWAVPKGVDRDKLFAYLKEIGKLDDLLSINSMTFNAYCKLELEQAIAAGNVDWRMPGTGEPNIQRSIRFRKG